MSWARSLATIGCLVVVSLSACGKSCTARAPERVEPLELRAIHLGRNVDATESVTDPTRTFSRDSVVYASIETTGVGKGTLIVEWSVGTPAMIVRTDRREISPTGPSTFAFHFSPPNGWPRGTNRIRFALDHGEPTPEQHIAEFRVD